MHFAKSLSSLKLLQTLILLCLSKAVTQVFYLLPQQAENPLKLLPIPRTSIFSVDMGD